MEASTIASSTKLLVANMRGDLFILDVINGKKLWGYEIGTPVSATPAVLKDRFIVAATDGTIYCFGTKK